MESIINGVAKSWTRLRDFHFHEILIILNQTKRVLVNIRYDKWKILYMKPQLGKKLSGK